MDGLPHGKSLSCRVKQVTDRQRCGRQQAVCREMVVPIPEALQLFLVEYTSCTTHGAGSRLFGTLAPHGLSGVAHLSRW